MIGISSMHNEMVLVFNQDANILHHKACVVR